MRQHYDTQRRFDSTPIGELMLNYDCRDEVIPVMAGLQYVYTCAPLRRKLVQLVAGDINQNSRRDVGRPGLDDWQIIVLAAVRLGLNYDYDKLQDQAENHRSLRTLLGIGDWEETTDFRARRIRDTLCQLQPNTLEAINHAIVSHGQELDGEAALSIRADSFVVETDIHYPSESTLIGDGMRKIIPLCARLAQEIGEAPPELDGQPSGVIGAYTFSTSTGEFVWTPAIAGTFSIGISVSDGNGSFTQTFDLVVLENAPPILTRDSLSVASLGQSYSVDLTASDPNGEDLTWSLVGTAPAGMTLTETTEGMATLAWTSPDPVGATEVTVRVEDDEDSDQHTFSLTVIDPNNNTPPVATGLTRSIQVGRQFLHQVQASDADGESISFSLPSGGPAGLTLDTNGWINWTPTANQAGEHTFVMEVKDARGATDQAAFTLTVIAEPANNRPVFTTEPRTLLVAGQAFVYDADAFDPDGDTVRFSLVAAPSGMTINAATGRIQWTPTLDDLGQHLLTVRVVDALGLSQDQTRTLTVNPVNRPPMFGGAIPPWTVAGEEYQADVIATDPDGHTVTHSLDTTLTNAPGSIAVTADGQLTWTPPVGTTGVFDIYVNAYDELGAGVRGWFRVEVLAEAPNNPPRFTNAPITVAEAGDPQSGPTWVYDAEAVDPDPGDTVTFSLNAPEPLLSDMTFNSTTGRIEWTPDSSLIGQLVPFEIWADDGKDQTKWRFSVRVVEPNTPPQITAVSDQTVTAGSLFRLDIHATDNQQAPLRYDLDVASVARGLLIDQNGAMTWTPDADDVGNPLTDVTVTVTDEGGLTSTVMFDVTVIADTEAPTVAIGLSTNQADVGDEVVIRVHATPEQDVAGRTLTLVSVKSDGQTTPLNQALTLDGAGRARLTLTEEMLGTIRFEATATDKAGNTSDVVFAELLVTDPADQSPPTVSISSPTSKQAVSAPVDVIGSVADDEIQNLSWTLIATPLDGGEPKQIASGTGPVDKAVLGRLDPTRLRNGFYHLTLTATDSGGNPSSDTTIVEVEGANKLGNFTMSFVDLEIPVLGLPITVTRTYDTLDADVEGDFGYGWSLDISTTKVTVDFGGEDLHTGLFGYTPFRDGTRVIVTLPDGSTEGFTFAGQPVSTGIVTSPDHTPTFIPDPGVTSELIVEPRYIRKLGSGYIDMGTGRDYTPVDPQLGGFYTLRLRNGTELVIDAQNGDLLTVTDRIGNTLSFTGQGIEHSAGRSIEFERDYAGRITAIIDPAGKRIRYEYDALGNLVSGTDRVEAETTFTYLDDPDNPHYLQAVYDPLGRPAATTEYDDLGRIKKVTDSDGKTIEYTWNSESRVQKVTDQLGHTTTITTDDRGNVIREEDPEGGIMLRTYDANDNMLTETTVVGLIDSTGNGETNDLTTIYTYDADDNQITVTDPLGNVTRNTYNEYSQPTSVTRQGVTTIYAYDASGLLRSTTDANDNVTSFDYDAKGNLTSLANDDNVTLVTMTYNQFGDVTSSMPATGRTTYFDYDLNGNQVASWYFDGEGAEEVQVLNVTRYDEANQVTATLHAILPTGQFITQDLATATISSQGASNNNLNKFIQV